MRHYLKLLSTFAIALCSINTFAQLDTIHWFPPLHSRDNAQIQDNYIYLSTPETTPFTVTIKDGSGAILATPTVSNASPFTYTVGTGQNAAAKLFVPIDSLSRVLSTKGIEVSASRPFYANVRARANSQAEVVTGKGAAAAGTTFRIGGMPQQTDDASRNFTAGIMALEDNTTVTISDYDAGVTFAGTTFTTPASLSVTLNKGQCYVISGYTDVVVNRAGIIGALVQASKPIILSNGNLLGQVAAIGSQDMGLDQIVPIERIGDKYILIEGNGNTNMEVPIVVAHYNNTAIYINGNATPIATINAGDYFVIPNTNYQGAPHKNMHVETSQPVYMYQALAGSTDNATGGLNFIPPYNCYLPRVIDLIPSVNSIGSTNYNGGIFVFTRQGTTLSVNGIPQTGAVAVPSVPWVTYKVTGLTGNVKLTANSPIAAGIFGASGSAGFAGYFSGFSSYLNPSNFSHTSTCVGSTTLFQAAIDTSLLADSIVWNFGDPATGNLNKGIGNNPTHIFSAAGNYTVQMIVYRCDNDTVTKTVYIENPPVADFTIGNICVNQPVNFTDNSTAQVPANITNRLWHFSPTDSSIATNPVYTFNADGTINVILIITTAGGCKDTITKQAIVPDTIVPTITNGLYISSSGACDGYASVTNVTGGTPNYTYLWSNGSNTATANNLCAGTNSVTITDSQGCTAQASIAHVLPLCLQDVDFNNWQQGGVPGNGNWQIQMGGAQVYQSVNGNPTFFITPNDLINVRIKGKMMTTDGDDDFLGFVFGLKSPVGNSTLYDMWLLDWKQRNQNDNSYSSYEGFALSKIKGNIPSGQNSKYFWGHTNDSILQVVDSLWGSGNGWVRNQTHQVEFVYTYSRAIIIIDGDTIFDRAECFQPGRFGFYNYSQPKVTYWDFTYELIADYQVTTPEICEGDTAKFTFVNVCPGQLDLSSVKELEWHFGDGKTLLNTNVTEATANPWYVYDTSGTFAVKMILRDFYGCSDTAINSIIVNPKPKPDFTTSDRCNGIAIPFNDASSVNNPGVITSYLWTLGDGNTETSTSFNHLFATPGNYNIKLVATTDKSCTDSILKTVTVFNNPVANFTVSNVCFPSDVTVINNSIVNNPASITTWQWNLGDGNTSTQQVPTIQYAVADTYTIQLITITGDGCVDTATQDVVTYPKPAALFTKTDTCANAAVNFIDASSVSNGSVKTWQWNFGNGNSSTTQNTTHTYSAAGTYNVELIITTDNNCRDTAIIQQEVFPIPQAAFSVGPVCYENASLFTDATTVASGNINQWIWDFGDSSTAAIQNPTHTYTSFGNYTVSLIAVSNHSCADTTSSSITVHPKPTTELAGDTVCLNIPSLFTQITTIGSGSIVSYNWSLGDGNTSSQANPNYTYANAGTYSLLLIVESDNGCTDTAGGTAIVHPRPLIDFNGSNVCLGFPTNFSNLTSIATGTISTYNWNFGDGIGNTQQTDATYTYTNIGTYSVTLTAISNNGCNDSLTKQVTVYENPLASVTTTPACFSESNGSATVSVTNGTPQYSYNWNNGYVSVTNNNLFAGNYSITVNDANNCTATASGIVTQPNSALEIYSDKEVYEILLGEDAPVLLTSNYSSVSYTITPNRFLSCADCSNPIATPVQTITYSITGTDSLGCKGNAEFTVDVSEAFPLYIPNVFSPNNDGSNEIFKIYSTGIQQFEMQLFNRWGEKVFETTDINTGWDGYIGGQKADAGVYVYTLSITYLSARTEKRKGTITLLR